MVQDSSRCASQRQIIFFFFAFPNETQTFLQFENCLIYEYGSEPSCIFILSLKKRIFPTRLSLSEDIFKAFHESFPNIFFLIFKRKRHKYVQVDQTRAFCTRKSFPNFLKRKSFMSLKLKLFDVNLKAYLDLSDVH